MVSELQMSNSQDVDHAVEAAEEGLKIWQTMKTVSNAA